jgi:hypothetical protein
MDLFGRLLLNIYLEEDVHIVLELIEKLQKNLYRKHKKFTEIGMIILKLYMVKISMILLK